MLYWKRKRCNKNIKKNIEKFKLGSKTKILIGDVFKIIEKKNFSELKFDLIFCDPPFNNTDVEKLIELILNKNLLNKNGIIILHRNRTSKEKLPEHFKIFEKRIYGISKIIFAIILS